MTKKWILLVLLLSISCTVFAQQKKAPAKVKGGDVQSQIGALEDDRFAD